MGMTFQQQTFRLGDFEITMVRDLAKREGEKFGEKFRDYILLRNWQDDKTVGTFYDLFELENVGNLIKELLENAK